MDRSARVPDVQQYSWIAGAVAVALLVVLVAGWGPIGAVMLSGYAALNAVGVAHFCEGLRGRRVTLQLVLRVLAVVLVPVSLVTVLRRSSGLTPGQRVTSGSLDDGVRRASAGQFGAMGPRSDGGGG